MGDETRDDRDRWLLPLALCSGLACAALAGRVALSGTGHFLFLAWNLILAWMPYLLARVAVRLWRSRGPLRLAAPAAGAGWLLFFPNAPYIVTDLVHLQRDRGFVWWYDVGLVALFALAGLFLAVASLAVMQRLVRAAAGGLAAWLFVLAAAGLGGVGVYLGRFLRWNSWDALLAPHAVLGSVAGILADPSELRHAVGFCAMFGSLLLASFFMINGGRSFADYADCAER
jgi:uncharacterized membrane protein